MSQEISEKAINSDEEEYNEDEDKDFVLGDPLKIKEDGSDFSETEEDIINNRKYSKVESETGGLIKTRHQRAQEAFVESRSSIVNKGNSSTSKSDINSIWEELNNKESKTTASVDSNLLVLGKGRIPVENDVTEGSTNKKIKIRRTYEFAGETITEDKFVDIDSQEAKAHLNSMKLTQTKLSDEIERNTKPIPSNLRRKRKRASLLDAVITNSSKSKLSTLEKSRLDWASYVDKNKINDELKYKNKDGYLEKQDFLNRVDSKQDQIARKASKKQ